MSKNANEPLAILQAVFFVQIDNSVIWDDQESKAKA